MNDLKGIPDEQEAVGSEAGADIAARLKAAREASAAFVEFKRAADNLKESPDDPAANLAAGKYRSLLQGNWGRGLPYLAKGSDEQLKKLASGDLASPASTAEQLRLADDWWDYSLTVKPPQQRVIQGRGAYWYKKTLPSINGVSELRARKRLREYASGETTDLLAKVDLTKDVISGTWARSGFTLASQEMQYLYKNEIMFPIEIDGSYELTVAFTRTNGSRGVGVIIPVGENYNARVWLSEVAGRFGGLELVNNKRVDQTGNPTTITPCPIVNGQRYNLTIQVEVHEKNATITAYLNKHRIIGWTGVQSSLWYAKYGQKEPAKKKAIFSCDEKGVLLQQAQFRVLPE